MFGFKNLNSGKIRVKLLATLLVLTLTFANFVLAISHIGESIAGIADVTFDVYFTNADGAKVEQADISSQEINLHVSVNVQNGGNLKNAVIKIEDTNFRFKDKPELTEIKIESVPVSKNIPIIARHDELYNLELLNMQSQIRLTGEYEDKDGNVEPLDISKPAKITWTSNEITKEDIDLSQEVITNKIYNIDGKNKRVVQLLVKSKIKDNKAPLESSIIEISNPKTGETTPVPANIKVASYGTKATNGKCLYSITQQNEKTIIEILNKAQDNIVSWKKDAEDIFVVTYIYDYNEEENVELSTFSSDIKNTVNVYGRTEAAVEKINQLPSTTVSEKGNIVNLETSITEKIYKGKMYIGEDTAYQEKSILYVSYSEVANTITIEDEADTILATAEEGQEPNSVSGISTYYKTTKINKADAKKVLGEGTITVYNAEDKTTPIQEIALAEETEGNYYTISYGEGVNKITIAMSSAKTEGTIEIINEKAIKVTSTETDISNLVLSAEQLKTNKKLLVTDEITVEENTNNIEIVNLDVTNTANLEEPKTTFDISVANGNLSTQIENKLEITTELKTVDSNNKLFNNPIIKIELPKEVAQASIEGEINAVLYNSGLTLDKTESKIVTNEAGNKELVIVLKGTQTNYNPSEQNATIVANLKVQTNEFMASKNVEIKATCINDGETANSTEVISLTSKSGLVTKNSITIGENVIEKINENTINTNIAENANANISSSIINNFGEDISNFSLLGNIPERITLTGAITSNAQGVKILYSEDLSNWQEQVADYSKIKAFKITLEELKNGSTIDLSYGISANIENIETNTALTNELTINYSINKQAKQEKIAFVINAAGSQTPSGPQNTDALITINPKTTTNTLYQGQIVTYQISVKNTSKKSLDNVTLVYNVPKGAVLTEFTYSQGTDIKFKDDTSENKTWTIESINPNQTITKEFTLKISSGAASITNKASLKDTENNPIAEFESKQTLIKEGKISARLSRYDNPIVKYKEKSKIKYVVIVKNNTNSTMNDVTVISQIPNQATWVEDSGTNKDWSYNKNTNKIERTINTLEPGQTLDLWFEVQVGKIPNDSCEATIENTAIVSLKTGEEYETNIYTSYVLMPKWDIHMTSTHNATLNEGDRVKYIITVSNTGKAESGVSVKDVLPEEIQFRKVTYYTNPEHKTESTLSRKEVNISNLVEVGETFTIEIEGVTYDLDKNVPSKKISNVAKIDLGDGEYLESETITNTIINDEIVEQEKEDSSDTYSISGLAWHDENKNGIREAQEKNITSLKVMLLNAKGNKIAETLTSLTGTYKFNNISKGEYIVIFDYDEEKYGVAKYQLKDANTNNNSDAISKQIKLDGENITVGVTDIIKIENENATNIDIGLIQNPEFDLSLDKYVSKVTLTNKSGTTTYTYNDSQLAKVEISQKELVGTVLLVEYEIEVTNDGDVDGYVTDIIDYLPEGLEFNSEMNTDWYLGTDKYLHYMTLDPQAIEPGKTEKIKLVLTKTLKSDSPGTIVNSAEIAESANLQAIPERDSTFNNKKDGEDDISKAELIISIKTGSPIMYIGIILLSMIILGTGIYLINKKVLRVKIY